MGVTLWYFVETADRSIVRVRATRYLAFHESRGTLQPSEPGEVRAIEVALAMSGRRIVQFITSWNRLYRVTADGHPDPEHTRQGMRLAANKMDGLLWDDEDVVQLGPLIAQREYARTHAWRPREEQLQWLANVLNQAATRPPVVAVTAGGLVPV